MPMGKALRSKNTPACIADLWSQKCSLLECSYSFRSAGPLRSQHMPIPQL